MDLWYSIISMLPFEWVSYSFMKNALLAILIITPMFGLVGTMIVSNKMAFFSDSIGHSALAGIALGVIFHVKAPLLSIIVFSVAFSIIILLIKNINKSSTDTTIGVVSSTVVAIGIVVLSSGGGFNKYSTYLIGDILSIAPLDILMACFLFVIVIVYWIFFFNKLLLTSLNHSFVGSRGINGLIYEASFVIMIALIVSFSIQWVGILIINSLLILPAAASRNIAKNMKEYHIYSVIFSVISGIIGLLLSFYIGTASGATIIIVAAVFYAGTLVLRKIR